MAKKSKPAKRVQTRTVNKKPAFLQAYIEYPNLSRAAAAVGIDRSNHYDWLESDPEYAKAFDVAVERAGRTLLDDAVNWVKEGVDEPIVYQGQFQYKQKPVTLCTLPDGREIDEKKLPKDLRDIQIVSRRTVFVPYGKPLTVRRKSEGVMLRLLGGFLPKMFNRRHLEVTGKDGAPLQLVARLEAARRRNSPAA